MFVGNSFTFVNDLPHQIVNIAKSLGDEIEVANSTIGGCTIYAQTATNDQRTAMLLQEDWDYIVLQDYSVHSSYISYVVTQYALCSFCRASQYKLLVVCNLVLPVYLIYKTSCETSMCSRNIELSLHNHLMILVTTT